MKSTVAKIQRTFRVCGSMHSWMAVKLSKVWKNVCTGRYAAADIVDPATGEVLVKANHMITPKRAAMVAEAGVTKVKIRTALSCRSHLGICAKCYGANMATGQVVQVG